MNLFVTCALFHFGKILGSRKSLLPAYICVMYKMFAPPCIYIVWSFYNIILRWALKWWTQFRTSILSSVGSVSSSHDNLFGACAGSWAEPC